MIHTRIPKLLFALTFLLLPCFHCGASFAKDVPTEAEMIAKLESDQTPQAEKAITCKQLAVFGSPACVDAVAALLPDPELSSWARITLEAIDDPSSETALIEALNKTKGLQLIGIVNSLGVKRSTDAVAAIIEKLGSDEEALARAAAISLGKIGGEQATQALKQGLADARMSVRSAVAEGLIRCAEQALPSGAEGRAEATALYELLLATELPTPRQVEATRGAILASGKDGIDLLVQSLASDNQRIRYIALTAARELRGEGVSEALLAARSRIPSSQAALYLIALGDRGETSMRDAMLQTIQQPASTDADIDVKTAAIGVVARIGDASCLDALIAAATDPNDVVAQAGRTALEAVGDDELNEEIKERAQAARGDELKTWIGVIGARRIDAIETLVGAIENDDQAIRTAAIKALGDVATLDELSILIDQAFADAGGSGDSQAVAATALRAACVRMTDKAACVDLLQATMDGAPPAVQVEILEILAAMGGGEALAAIEKTALSQSRELQNAATRLLGGWMTVDGAEVLMNISKQPQHLYRIRAVRGYLRIVRQFVMPQKQREMMTLAAIDISDRDDERRLILDAASRYPSLTMLKIAVQMSNTPSLKNEAQAAAITIAQKLDSSPEVEKLLAELDLQEMEIEITRASYGAADQRVDVTARLQNQVGKLPIIVLDNPNFNSTFGGDPAPGSPKQLRVEYRIDGREGTAVFKENTAIVLPIPK